MSGMWVILALMICGVSADGELKEAFHDFIKSVNCGKEPAPSTVEEISTAFDSCKQKHPGIDEKCIFSCVANEMKLVQNGALNEAEVSRHMDNQLQTTPDDKAVWMTGIKKCTELHKASGNTIPTEFKDCSKEETGLSHLSHCIIKTRNCPGAKGRSWGSFTKAMKPAGMAALKAGQKELGK